MLRNLIRALQTKVAKTFERNMRAFTAMNSRDGGFFDIDNVSLSRESNIHVHHGNKVGSSNSTVNRNMNSNKMSCNNSANIGANTYPKIG